MGILQGSVHHFKHGLHTSLCALGVTLRSNIDSTQFAPRRPQLSSLAMCANGRRIQPLVVEAKKEVAGQDRLQLLATMRYAVAYSLML